MVSKQSSGSTNPILFVVSVLVLCCKVLNSSLVVGINTIRVGDKLSFTDKLVSEDGKFTLGFFNKSGSPYSYLGIWLSEVEDSEWVTKVWVAGTDPNALLYGMSHVLTVDSTGRLKITSISSDNQTTILLISSDNQQKTANATATLQDSGNFVLTDEITKQTLWQSFDHPTSVLLRSMKLGFNAATGQNWSLTSSLSYSDLGSGAFTLNWEPNINSTGSGQFVIRRRGELYWTKRLDDPSWGWSSHIRYETNNDDKYITFYGCKDNPAFTMWWLSPNGKFDYYSGSSSSTDPVDFCYGYETGEGCVSSELPHCRKSNDKFVEIRASLYPSNDSNVLNNYSDSLSLSDCMEWCWNTCDCFGFYNISEDGTGCFFWTGKSLYIENANSSLVYVLVPQTISSQGKKRRTWGSISFVVFVLGFLCYLTMRKRGQEGEEKKRQNVHLKELTTSESYINENDGVEGHDLKIFGFASISEATNNFSNENKLGEGGFGPVYKGRLMDGSKIAVKRLSGKSGQGVVEFKTELKLISKLQHVNLVRLLGCCIQGDEKMLIYEHMLNKSLDSFLFDPIGREQLTWTKRFSIIEGIAQGLLYLHKYSRLKIIHRDLKPSNILLDENMNPKISDFGMAKLFKQNVLEANTNRLVGTYGYMAPEYAMGGMFSVKSDVFSFGVLMLEIVSGRKNNSFDHLDGPLNLVGYAWELWNKDAAVELMDPVLSDSCVGPQLLLCIHVGLLCVEDRAVDRPTISDVIYMLTNDTVALPMPKKPAFVYRRSVGEEDSNMLKKDSVNKLSISISAKLGR